MFAHLISLVVVGELTSLRTLVWSVHAARNFANMRDTETGAHLERMPRYARIVAKEFAPKYGFDDEYIEHVFLFSPLHDIGKIGIPDSVLLKAGLLDPGEQEVMKTHSEKGRQLIDSMLCDFGLESFGYLNILRNIAEYHYETLDGEGYPHGLRGGDIPIESRIVAVADIFGALTSKRPIRKHGTWTMLSRNCASLQAISSTPIVSRCLSRIEPSWKRSGTASRKPRFLIRRLDPEPRMPALP